LRRALQVKPGVFDGLRREQRVLVRMTLGAAFLGESRRGRRPGLVFHLAVGVARSSTQVRRGGSVCEGVGRNSRGPGAKASSEVRGCLLSALTTVSACKGSPQQLLTCARNASGSSAARAYRHPVDAVARNRQPSNNGLQLTRPQGVPPSPFARGAVVEGGLAAEAKC
jgi:hypothetical protein